MQPRSASRFRSRASTLTIPQRLWNLSDGRHRSRWSSKPAHLRARFAAKLIRVAEKNIGQCSGDFTSPPTRCPQSEGGGMKPPLRVIWQVSEGLLPQTSALRSAMARSDTLRLSIGAATLCLHAGPSSHLELPCLFPNVYVEQAAEGSGFRGNRGPSKQRFDAPACPKFATDSPPRMRRGPGVVSLCKALLDTTPASGQPSPRHRRGIRRPSPLSSAGWPTAQLSDSPLALVLLDAHLRLRQPSSPSTT
jgi:hypothetical protein